MAQHPTILYNPAGRVSCHVEETDRQAICIISDWLVTSFADRPYAGSDGEVIRFALRRTAAELISRAQKMERKRAQRTKRNIKRITNEKSKQ